MRKIIAAPTKVEFLQPELVLKNPQACCFSNPEVATKHLARTERLSYKDGTNYFTKNSCQEPSGPRIVKKIRSFLLKAAALILHHR
jgi:hypothetical protein